MLKQFFIRPKDEHHEEALRLEINGLKKRRARYDFKRYV